VFNGDNPPEFIYGSQEAELVKEKYATVYKEDQATELFVRGDKLGGLSEDELARLNQRGMKINE
jgi:hypothetical protein